MSIITINQLKAKFESGDWPRSADYMDLIDTLAAMPESVTSVLNGSGVPSSEIGSEGSFYINTVNYDIYGPKNSGSWGSPTSLVGPTGATGAQGVQGLTGSTGAGVVSGGTTGQYLTKVDGTNYNTQWSTLDLSGKQDVVANVSSTEIGYLDGVASSIQTQINAKSPLESPTFTGTPSAPTATQGNNTTQIATTAYVDTAVSNIIDAAPTTLNTLNEIAAALGDDANYATTITTALGNKQAIVSGVSDTEIGYLDGVTSAIQTQLNAKQAIVSGVSDTEIGYLDGVTSGIQTQLDSKDSSEQSMTIALSDEATPITAGNSKLTMRAPFAMTLTKIPRASLKTASTSGIPTVDINENGTTILSTKLTIDANEKTSTTAATAAVLSDTSIADDAEITFDIDVSGTGAIGLKVTLYYKKV